MAGRGVERRGPWRTIQSEAPELDLTVSFSSHLRCPGCMPFLDSPNLEAHLRRPHYYFNCSDDRSTSKPGVTGKGSN